ARAGGDPGQPPLALADAQPVAGTRRDREPAPRELPGGCDIAAQASCLGQRPREHSVPLWEAELLELAHGVLEQRDRRLRIAPLDVGVAEEAGGIDATHAVGRELAAPLAVVDGERGVSPPGGDPPA